MRLRSRFVLALLLIVSASFFIPSSAIAGHCSSVHTPYITAKNVRTLPGLGCSLARKTLKRYFRKVVSSSQTPGGCAQVRASNGCRVRSFRCYSRYANRRIRGICTGPLGAVRFREYDIGLK